jgi:hypothetical protein
VTVVTGTKLYIHAVTERSDDWSWTCTRESVWSGINAHGDWGTLCTGVDFEVGSRSRAG